MEVCKVHLKAPRHNSFWGLFPKVSLLSNSWSASNFSSGMKAFFIATCECIDGIPWMLDSGLLHSIYRCCALLTASEACLFAIQLCSRGSGNANLFGRAGAVGSSDTTDHCHKWVSDSSPNRKSECMRRLLNPPLAFFSFWPLL